MEFDEEMAALLRDSDMAQPRFLHQLAQLMLMTQCSPQMRGQRLLVGKHNKPYKQQNPHNSRFIGTLSGTRVRPIVSPLEQHRQDNQLM